MSSSDQDPDTHTQFQQGELWVMWFSGSNHGGASPYRLPVSWSSLRVTWSAQRSALSSQKGKASVLHPSLGCSPSVHALACAAAAPRPDGHATAHTTSLPWHVDICMWCLNVLCFHSPRPLTARPGGRRKSSECWSRA